MMTIHFIKLNLNAILLLAKVNISQLSFLITLNPQKHSAASLSFRQYMITK